MSYQTEDDIAEIISGAIDRYTSRGIATHIVPAHGSHPARVLVSPEPDTLGAPVQVFAVTVTEPFEISTPDDWRKMAMAYGFRLEATEIAHSIGLTDYDDTRHRWDAEPKEGNQ